MKSKLFFLVIFFILFVSCEEKSDIPHTTVDILIEYPSDLEELSVQYETVKFKNISSGMETEYSNSKQFSLPEGLYDCSYEASVTYLKNGEMTEGKLRGYQASLKVLGTDVKVTLESYLLEDKNDFIIEEIFFTGTLQPSGKQYNGDQYVKIYNNTDHVLYADGVSLMESKFITVTKYDYTPDIMKEAMTVQAIYTIPGNGTDHPVQPGESLIICDTGMDHRVANPNSFDLSRADLPAGTFPMEQTAYKVPNEWIIDAVNTSVESRYVWNVTDPSLDSGWTHCGTIDGDKTRYFKSVRRKLLYITRDGRKVLKDTNNSSDDFNTECVPSLIEEQHTATDANGTPAVNITYDGVTPKTE